jgi:deoxyinosine 3'endonuclease (endonuclease V)
MEVFKELPRTNGELFIMKIHYQHPWNISAKEAHQIQTQLRNRVNLAVQKPISSIKTIAAADISYSRGSKNLYGAVVLVRFPELRIKTVYYSTSEITFPSDQKGGYSILFDGVEAVGVVLRTRSGVKPVFVSPGHQLDIEAAREIIMNCIGRYRIPEPLRHAHQYVNEFRRKNEIQNIA